MAAREIDMSSGIRAAIDDFNSQLSACRRVSEIDGRSFILTSRVLDWFRDPPHKEPGAKGTNAGRVLNAVYDDAGPNLVNKLLSHMSDDDGKCWLRTFTILLQLNMGRFISRFYDLDVLDSKLPMGKNDLVKYINYMVPLESNAKDFAAKFWALQWELYTQKAFHEAYNQIYDFGEMILPITTKVNLKKGGSGTIFGIEVPCECIPPSLSQKIKKSPYMKEDVDGSPEGEYQQFALKVLDHPTLYGNETRAYQALEMTEGIVQCLGFWKFKRSLNVTEYHLLLEWGSYDLADFFRLYPSPTTTDGILQFWAALFSIAFALSKIHRLESQNDDHKTIYFGWHGDLKPGNILYCEEGMKKGWKIADPGFAKFVKEGKAKVEEGLPVVEVKGGTTTYGGPERVQDEGVPVSQRFDIWSLGCVLSEAATWVVLGYRGVELFRLVRKSLQTGRHDADQQSSSEDSDGSDISDISLNKIRGRDRFHDGKQVSKAVTDWHTHLRHSLRARDPITPAILRMVEAHMLKGDAKERLDADEIVKKMRALLDSSKAESKGYKVPSYSRDAIKQEQHREAKMIQTLLAREGAKSLKYKYKSKPFIEASKEPLGDGLADDINGFLANIPRDQRLGFLDQDRIHTSNDSPRRRTTLPAPCLRNSKFTFSEGSSLPPVMGPHKISTPENVLCVDYMGARKLLDEAGWKSGTLELPEGPQKTWATKPGPVTPHSPEQYNPGSSIGSPSVPTTPPPNVGKANRLSMSLMRQRFGRLSSSIKRRSVGPPLPVTPKPTETVVPKLETTAIQPSPTTNSPTDTRRSVSEEHKYKQFDEYFKDRDVVLLVDNGSSMYEHWVWARDLISVLVAFIYGQDDDGMELYFTSSKKPYGTFNEPIEFIEAMNKMKPKAVESVGTPVVEGHPAPLMDAKSDTASTLTTDDLDPDDIREVLPEILSLWRRKYKRKLTLIILTDGVWPHLTIKRTVANEIIRCLEKWQDKNALKQLLDTRGLSIQFVRFGHDREAIEELDWMDNNLTATNGTRLPDIIDHEPADGNIYKMILGSLDPKYDDQTDTVTGDDVGNDLLHNDFETEEHENSVIMTEVGSVRRTPSKSGKYVVHTTGGFEKSREKSKTFHVA